MTWLLKLWFKMYFKVTFLFWHYNVSFFKVCVKKQSWHYTIFKQSYLFNIVLPASAVFLNVLLRFEADYKCTLNTIKCTSLALYYGAAMQSPIILRLLYKTDVVACISTANSFEKANTLNMCKRNGDFTD